MTQKYIYVVLCISFGATLQCMNTVDLAKQTAKTLPFTREKTFPVDTTTLYDFHHQKEQLLAYIQQRAQYRKDPSIFRYDNLVLDLNPSEFVTFHHHAEAILSRQEQIHRIHTSKPTPCLTQYAQKEYHTLCNDDPTLLQLHKNAILAWDVHRDAYARNPYKSLTKQFLNTMLQPESPALLQEHPPYIYFTHSQLRDIYTSTSDAPWKTSAIHGMIGCVYAQKGFELQQQ